MLNEGFSTAVLPSGLIEELPYLRFKPFILKTFSQLLSRSPKTKIDELLLGIEALDLSERELKLIPVVNLLTLIYFRYSTILSNEDKFNLEATCSNCENVNKIEVDLNTDLNYGDFVDVINNLKDKIELNGETKDIYIKSSIWKLKTILETIPNDTDLMLIAPLLFLMPDKDVNPFTIKTNLENVKYLENEWITLSYFLKLGVFNNLKIVKKCSHCNEDINIEEVSFITKLPFLFLQHRNISQGQIINIKNI